MELVINRVQYLFEQSNNTKIIVSKDNNLAYRFMWKYFLKKFENKNNLIDWAESNNIKDDKHISYEFSNEYIGDFLSIPMIEYFGYKYQCFLLSKGLLSQGFTVDFYPLAVSLSCYKKINTYNNNWDLYDKYDFSINVHSKEVTYNIGSQNTLISTNEIDIIDAFNRVRIINTQNKILRTEYSETNKGKVVANREILKHYKLSPNRPTINYKNRYSKLLNFYNEYLKNYDFENLKFISTGFESKSSQKVSFERNLMVFKNGNKDINPITGMRNFGVFKEAPKSTDIKFLFIYQNKDDANALYKYLKNGYKGFPGLERYVGISLTLADSIEKDKYKQLQYRIRDTLLQEYEEFEKHELPEQQYSDLFALVIGDFDKNNPSNVYYELKTMLLKKGIPSQFIKETNIRKTSVFNYHLQNIEIGRKEKRGGRKERRGERRDR